MTNPTPPPPDYLGDFVAIDTETELLGPAYRIPRMVCLSASDSAGSYLWHQQDPALLTYMAGLLRSPRVVIMHNAAFDVPVIGRRFPQLLPLLFQKYERGEIIDTMLWAKLVDLRHGHMGWTAPWSGAGAQDIWGDEEDVEAEDKPKRASYSLQALVQKYLGRYIDKGEDTWRTRYAALMDTPVERWPADAKKYAIDDATNTREVALAMRAGYRPPDMTIHTRAHLALALSSAWGVRTDGDMVDRLDKELEAALTKHGAILAAAGLLTPMGNISKAKERQRVLDASAEGSVDVSYTKTGQVKTTAAILKKLQGDPVLAALLAYRQAEKLRGTYVPAIRRGVSVPLCPDYNPLLETGRTSCRAPINIQNLPKEGSVRACFVAREGKAWISVDYKQLELVTFAEVLTEMAGEEAPLAKAINEGTDCHVLLASDIAGCSYAEGLARHKAKDPEFKRLRQLAKAANFGYGGGMGAAKFADYLAPQGVTISDDEARRVRALWMQRWEVWRYFDHITNITKNEGGDVRQLYSGRIRGRCHFTQAANTYFQGLAADGAKAALWRYTVEAYTNHNSPLFGSRLVAFIHDELVVECDQDKIHEVGEALAALMCAEMQRWTPHVKVSADPAAMARWYKDADEVRDASGRLQLWQPKTKGDT